jgi:hypothetical protein
MATVIDRKVLEPSGNALAARSRWVEVRGEVEAFRAENAEVLLALTLKDQALADAEKDAKDAFRAEVPEGERAVAFAGTAVTGTRQSIDVVDAARFLKLSDKAIQTALDAGAFKIDAKVIDALIVKGALPQAAKLCLSTGMGSLAIYLDTKGKK